MKYTNYILLLLITIAAACTQSAKHHEHESDSASSSENPNQALYEQVMDIHDEIMPRAEDIYQLKKGLQEKLANTPSLVAETKKDIELVIAQLDSADNSMMEWMHEFRPLPDSADQEKARAYLESEMERIKKVKELMNESIEKAKAVKN